MEQLAHLPLPDKLTALLVWLNDQPKIRTEEDDASIQWFRASLNMGHVGAGKAAADRTIYIQAPNLLAAWARAKRFPGAKKSRRGTCGNSIAPAEVPEGTARRDLWYWRRPQLDKLKEM